MHNWLYLPLRTLVSRVDQSHRLQDFAQVWMVCKPSVPRTVYVQPSGRSIRAASKIKLLRMIQRHQLSFTYTLHLISGAWSGFPVERQSHFCRGRCRLADERNNCSRTSNDFTYIERRHGPCHRESNLHVRIEVLPGAFAVSYKAESLRCAKGIIDKST